MKISDHINGTEVEWLISNGLGGYASSTASAANTRKYHGLLIASLNPPLDRRLLLSSLDEKLMIADVSFEFAVHRYPGTIHPRGNEYLVDFTNVPFPTYTYLAAGITIKKQIMLPHGYNSTMIRYDISNPSGTRGTLRISPMVNNRSIHHLTDAGKLRFAQKTIHGGLLLESEDLHFYLYSDMIYRKDENWYYNFQYELELLRGYPYREDNFSPGHFYVDVAPGKTSCFIVASTEKDSEWDLSRINRLYDKEMGRINGYASEDMQKDPFFRKLVIAADSFIVDRRSTGSRSVIAGYPWFGDWGRDTMISLAGLTLVTGRSNDARSILSTFASYCKEGLIPNLFPEDSLGLPAYNTVDASLWFVHAVGRYMDYSGDMEFTKALWPAVRNILESYRLGTAYDIRMDDDGLVEHGSQLTWMDAKIGDWEATPRRGKACEINALWYNALMYAVKIGNRLGYDTTIFLERSKLASENFRKKFWNPEMNCLYDCISGFGEDWKDASVRPNQVFAVSLPFTMLSKDMEKSIVDMLGRELLTPYGLRTLSPSDKNYIGKYTGDLKSRDLAYHNGTVWPWLLGPYITAYSKVYRDLPDLKDRLIHFMVRLQAHMNEACVGTISEVFDGDEPHKPGGCVSQAWSVAEILRCYAEDILHHGPPE